MRPERQVVIIGGGFFGCSMALMLRDQGLTPIVIEECGELMMHASRVNQARVHGGYHYPRSLLTAYRARQNYERFKREYRDAIHDRFTKVYAVGRLFSKVTASQFERFMGRIGAPLKVASGDIQSIFDPILTEKVWIADECAFDISVLREMVQRKMEEAGIEIRFGTTVESACRSESETVAQLSDGSAISCERLFNVTYAGLNRLTSASGGQLIPLKHELTEMALVDLPEQLEGISVTMMCGPFFSFMPYPSLGMSTLSHVRYTPHSQWYEGPGLPAVNPLDVLASARKESRFELMRADASRYIPALRAAKYRDSLWTIKTLLPLSEVDDGRPILFRPDPGNPDIIHVMGGKIDNIFDVEKRIKEMFK